MTIFLKTVILLTGLGIAGAGQVYAQFLVTPTRQEIELSPGETHKGTYEVTNTTEKPMILQLTMRDWHPLAMNKRLGNVVKNWLTVDVPSKAFAPGEKRKVPFTIQVPEEAIGTIAAMVSFADATHKGFQTLLSHPLYVNVKDSGKVDWEFESLNLTCRKNFLKAKATLKNTGDYYLRPEGRAKLFHLGRPGKPIKERKEVSDFAFDYGNPIYPGVTRSFIGNRRGCDDLYGDYIVEALFIAREKKVFKTRKFKMSIEGEMTVE